jgi:hypothetical protein
VAGKKAPPVRTVYPASEFRFDADRMTCECPQGEMLSYYGTYTNSQGDEVAHFGGRLLQCRPCPVKTQCMHNPARADHRKGSGRQVSFVVSKNAQSKTPHTDWMKARIDSDVGKAIYSQRMSVVEPVFGNITANKRLRRFSLRGQRKVHGQWQLFCLVHNIEKLQNFGSLAR